MSPMRARRLCAYLGCSELVRGSDRYCDAHDKELRREFEKTRPTATQRGYGYRWQKLRKMVLNEEPVCPDPYGLHPGRVVYTTDVDHIVPKRDGGTDRRSNLQALCHSCHSHKSAKEDGAFGNRRKRGEMNQSARLTSDQVVDIRKKKSEGVPTAILAALYGVSKGHINDICAGRKWSHV